MKLGWRAAGAGLAAALSAVPVLAAQEKAVDLRSIARPAAPTRFEGLFAAYARAQRAGDAEGAARTFQEIRRLRIERNILGLEDVGLALVARGAEQLRAGDRDGAESQFASAAALAPSLPDAHLGLALVELKRGLFGLVPAVRHTLRALFARLPTARGEYYALALLVPVGVLGFFAVCAVLATALMLRHGLLLRHDLEESLGTKQSRSVSLAIYLLLLLLPMAVFQGWGWVFLWWLALVFVYLGRSERFAALVFFLGALAVGPLTAMLEERVAAARNPVFWASVQSVEGDADPRAAQALERAAKSSPDDRDLAYLYGAQLKKAGRYDDAAEVYRELLRTSPEDPVARNNLANVEFARGEFPAALARYRQGAESATNPEFKATFFYNQSLAHLQKFEMQPADEALSQARRLASGLISTYDRQWKYDKGDYAVVDLGLDTDQVEEKFAGVINGSGRKNVFTQGQVGRSLASTLWSRFAGFLIVAVLTVGAISFWRGRRMFTMCCQKCGTPFCRRCHLGAAVAGLCTQCYHLFVVRDGVSGPARNQKLLEVQREEDRRHRMFRLLSLISPGAGHAYVGAPFSAIAFSVPWYLTLVALALAERVLPFTEAPRALLAAPWGLLLASLVLVAVYVAANRLKPAIEVLVPRRRPGAPVRRAARA